MHLRLITICLVATVAWAQIQPIENNPPKNKPSDARLSGSKRKGQKANIDTTFGGLVGAKNPRARSQQTARLSKTGQGRVQGDSAGTKFGAQRNRDAQGNLANSVATGIDRARKSDGFANGYLNKESGGEVNTNVKGGKNAGVSYGKNSAGELVGDLQSEGQTAAVRGTGRGGKDVFTYRGSRGNNYKIDPHAQSRTSGNGDITADSRNNKGDGDYVYTIRNDARRTGSAMLKDKNPSAGRSGFEWTCTGNKVGSTTCRNARGETVGRAQADEQGKVRLYDKRDRLIGRGETVKLGPKKYVVNLNKPENSRRQEDSKYLGSIDGWSYYDCYRQVARRTDPKKDDVKILKPFRFTYNKQGSGNSVTYKYPDCFRVEGRIQLAPGVNVKDLALEFRAKINPLGDLKCADPGTCGRACYYCDFCQEESARWKLVHDNADSNVCSRTGGNTYSVSATVCPPGPEKVPIGTKFERSFSSSYWTRPNADSLETMILVWKRPVKTEDMQNGFFSKLESEGDEFRDSVKSTSFIKGLLSGGGINAQLSDYELLQAWIREQTFTLSKNYKEELLECDGAKTDFDLAGSKVGGRFLVAASDTLLNKGSIESSVYNKPVSSNVQRLQQTEFDTLQRAWVNNGKPRGYQGGLLSGIGNLGGLGGLGRK